MNKPKQAKNAREVTTNYFLAWFRYCLDGNTFNASVWNEMYEHAKALDGMNYLEIIFGPGPAPGPQGLRILHDIDFRFANFYGATMRNILFDNCDFRGVDLSMAKMEHCRLANCRLEACDYVCIWDTCTFDKTQFSGEKKFAGTFINSKFRDCDFLSLEHNSRSEKQYEFRNCVAERGGFHHQTFLGSIDGFQLKDATLNYVKFVNVKADRVAMNAGHFNHTSISNDMAREEEYPEDPNWVACDFDQLEFMEECWIDWSVMHQCKLLCVDREDLKKLEFLNPERFQTQGNAVLHYVDDAHIRDVLADEQLVF